MYSNYTDRILGSNTKPILGLVMRPYTLGHHIILKQAGVRFVSGSFADCTCYEDTIPDIVTTLAVCSSTYDEVLDEIASGAFERFIVAWSKRIERELTTPYERGIIRLMQGRRLGLLRYVAINFLKLCDRVHVRTKGRPRFSLPHLFNQVGQYVSNGTEAPDFEPVNVTHGKAPVIDLEQAIKDTLMAKFNYTRDDIFNKSPLTETHSTYLWHLHDNDAIRLKSRKEIEIVERIKQLKEMEKANVQSGS